MPELRRPREKEGQDDVMLLDLGGYHQRERNKAGEGIQLLMFNPPCCFMRAVIKDWLVVLWFCCHRTPHVSDRHKDQCHRPWESCSVIYQRIATCFSSYLSFGNRLLGPLWIPENHKMSSLLYPKVLLEDCTACISPDLPEPHSVSALCQVNSVSH